MSNQENNIDQLIKLKNLKSNNRIFKNYYSIPFIITLLCITSWIFGNGNIQLIRYWYFISMCILLGIRISEFIEIKNHHYLLEMCYYINILTMIIVIMNYDIRMIYSFTHGPLLFYCILFKDAPIPDRLTRVLSFSIHCYSALVTRKIYWTENYDFEQYLTWENFLSEFVCSLQIYLVWFLLYSIYLIKYDGKSNNMIRYICKIDTNTNLSIKIKILYLISHFIAIIITCSFGILFRYNYWLNNFVVSLMIISSIYQTGKFYYKHQIS
jgi:hypothetical protein